MIMRSSLFPGLRPNPPPAALDRSVVRRRVVVSLARGFALGTSAGSAHAVARLLVPVLPRVRVLEFDGLGHMAPVTHPDRVNAQIVQFLGEVLDAGPSLPSRGKGENE